MHITLESVWNQFLHIAHDEVGSRVVETWFKAVTLARWDENTKTVYLHAPNVFVRDWIEKHYLSLFQTHLARLLHVEKPTVIIQTDVVVSQEVTVLEPVVVEPTSVKNNTKYTPARVLRKKLTIASKSGYSSSLNKNYLFDNFIVGPNNSLSYAACQAVTQKLGRLYNPLFVYGDSGLGKTHLLHAIGNEVCIKNPSSSILYQTADRFVNEFISAIRFNNVHKFQKKYQKIDLLLVDDIQFISNKDQTQEAFFHIFNALYDANKQIVFTSDVYPQKISGIADRLRSRLVSGLVTDIYAPHLETKIAIVKKKAEEHKEVISDEVAQYIAQNAGENIRELQGGLMRVIASASLCNQRITLELAKQIIVPTEKECTEPHHAIDVKIIVKGIAKFYPYTLKDLRSKSRCKEVVRARQIVMFLLQKMTDMSLREIGLFLGGKNHATVKYASAKIERMKKENRDFAQHILHIQKDILELN